MMEKLMTTDGGSAYRRKSIKTYKEIVEEKWDKLKSLHPEDLDLANCGGLVSMIALKYSDKATV